MIDDNFDDVKYLPLPTGEEVDTKAFGIEILRRSFKTTLYSYNFCKTEKEKALKDALRIQENEIKYLEQLRNLKATIDTLLK